MSQSVWHKTDLGRMAETVIYLALEANDGHSAEFMRGVAAGVLSFAHAIGAPVTLPKTTVVEALPVTGSAMARREIAAP